MNLFLDTNILIDFVANRQPFSNWAYQIFKDQKFGKWTLYSSSSTILVTYYIIEKQLGRNKSKQAIKKLLDRIEIISVEKNEILKALISNFNDFEDAVQHECALKIQDLDYIITRNKKDYKNSLIPILSSEELYID